ncbi:branched-chain amino acid transport system permease protein [Meinhardsimonia xiamenensis]|jgi:branched-chain amino acid transport system permease protein|uniref:Branched-chain amino acid transport system permease protein n=1 Tax=Meinhardsimonia xiamenensis TaxID=990712 RepID=A0A1G9FLE3_9RHOB|nr:branched-chain amino acid ABC transporter permease [Meinhardsimonia xiamenensis]PRX37786.1 amino acid/amide ABC transporter membrane protein 2 (HAAT family) [Meinhardsimonia xiamenensis]SDK89197.1 branched-chain amino acid transport system permease protein [Meinhardsimonia xiamenensis]
MSMRKLALYGALLLLTVAAPFLFPAYQTQLATLWLMIIVALTWDMTGGQMGYNSLGNIFFYGTGMYVGAVITITLYFPLAEYTDASRSETFTFTPEMYFTGMVLGTLGAGLFCALSAYAIGPLFFGLRGPYFAIGTLGLAIAAGEIVSNIDILGGGQGISMPVYGGDFEVFKKIIYYVFAAMGVVLIVFLSWFYQTRFGKAINAIRDDEEKAEAMGIHTLRYKLVTWAISAFFVGMAGSISAFQLIHFEPLETAYQTINLGIFMVVCVLLGGKGTLWGPVIGAILFHVFKEVTWNYLLGWQWVALGALIVVIVVFFQDGLMGWLRHRKPEWFGIRVESREARASA